MPACAVTLLFLYETWRLRIIVKSMLSLDQIFRPSADVVACDLSDGKALLSLETSKYFKLNDSAAVVWASVETGAKLDQIVDAMLQRFDVDKATCTDDVLAILEIFNKAGLIETSDLAPS